MEIINLVIPAASVTIYLALLAVLLNSQLNHIKRVFIWYLTATMCWSLISFLLHANFFPDHSLIINEFLSIVGTTMVVAYYHFSLAFTGRREPLLFVSSLTFIVITVVLNLSGLIMLSSTVVDHLIYYTTGPLNYLIILGSFAFMGRAVFHFVQKYRHSVDPIERNRIAVLLFGMGVLVVFALTSLSKPISKYPLDHAGNIANALIITYAILKYQLVNIQSVARKGLTYFIVTGILSGTYTGFILISRIYFPSLPLYSVLLLAFSAAILLFILAGPFRVVTQRFIDRFFYRDTYKYRMTLLNFDRLNGLIINLNELAQALLPAVTKALCINGTKLLLRENGNGAFTPQFAFPEAEEQYDRSIVLSPDNPIVSWLEKRNRPLEIEQVNSIPEFKGLWKTERDHVMSSNLALLCPVKSRGELIGILALGCKKNCYNPFSQEDIELLMNSANQAGIIIHNAQRYSQALLKANTDGLTGLYNHRHFHERLEQEIARSSRFGAVFSLIILDIDLFKTYNDNLGHLAGDEILRRIAEYIKASIRTIDVACRYGGEEFSVILPETRLADAFTVAERIRKAIEAKTSTLAMPVTVSVGVASWPMDGVTKEDLISKTDRALYHAKESGRNRTCLSTDLVEGNTPANGEANESKPKALSIIYALAATLDAKDHYTYGHSRKVSEYAAAIAESLDLSQERVANIRTAGLLHDIGKIGIPDSILNKKEPLLADEWEPIKSHTRLGVEILRHISDLASCLPAILYHHERFDGEGYPSKLKGKDIPLEARVLAIADAYDAMISPRPYRGEMLPVYAIQELQRCAGTQFDPELVNVFIRILESVPAKG